MDEGARDLLRDLFLKLEPEMEKEKLEGSEFIDCPICKFSAIEAKLKEEANFEKFRVVQDQEFISDFDREVKRLLGENDAE